MTKKKKSSRNAFISSVLMICLTFTMFVGTTYAWYNDSVTSGRNTIVAGSLEMAIQYYTGTIGDTDSEAFADDQWTDITDQTAIFSDSATFEPGAAQVAYVRVKNGGDLAFKYSLALAVYEKTVGKNKAGDDLDLTNYLKFGTATVEKPFRKSATGRDDAIAAASFSNISSTDFVTSAILEAKDDANNKTGISDVIALVVYMPASLGNEVNPDPDHKPDITFGLNALATQAVIENDSFSNTYDAAATLNFAPVTTAATFNDALSAGRSASLENDVALGEAYTINAQSTNKDVEIDGNGNTLSSTTGTRIIDIDEADGSSVTLNDVKVDAANKERAISIWGSDDVEVNVNGSEVEAIKYAINIAGSNDNVELNIDNSTVTGWCAFQSWSPNSVINVNNSTLIGNNQWSGTSNAFGTIVINEGATGNVITIRNSRIEANQYGDQKQWFVLFKDAATVIFEDCTFWKNGTEITMDEIFSSNFGNYFAFTSQAAIDGSHLVINGETVL